MKRVIINKDQILRYEPYFDSHVITAFINHETKTIRQTHGYFKPHRYGKYNEKLALKLGYEFY
jgi:hypothetical protein